MDDLDAELLGLAEGTSGSNAPYHHHHHHHGGSGSGTNKRKRSHTATNTGSSGSTNKKTKQVNKAKRVVASQAVVDSASDMDMSTDDEQDDQSGGDQQQHDHDQDGNSDEQTDSSLDPSQDHSSDDEDDDDDVSRSNKKPARKATKFDADDNSDSDRGDRARRQAGGRGAGGGQDEDLDPAKLFPLEGKYENEQDRRTILAMTELEREEVLGERADRVAQLQQRRQLREMVKRKERREHGQRSDEDDDDKDSDSGTLRRKPKAKAPASKYDKLKRSRAERGKKKERVRNDDDDEEDDDEGDNATRTRKQRSESVNDDYTDSGSDVDSRQRSRPDKRQPKAGKGGSKKAASEVASMGKLREIVVPRAKLAEFCAAPWFEEWAKGAWVRYLLGRDSRGQNSYRLCQIENVKDDPSRPYRIENVSTTLQLELRHGNAVKWFTMDAVSDSPFSDGEFARLKADYEHDKFDLPTMKEVDKIKAKLDQHKEYIMTEADVATLLAKKGARVNPTASKARLLIQRDFAIQTNDVALLDEINRNLAKFDVLPRSPSSQDLTATNGGTPGGGGGGAGFANTEQERMRRVNERNRASNREEIKRAEGRAQDERRRQAVALKRGDSEVKIDPSARVKTMTRLKYDRNEQSSTAAASVGNQTPQNSATTTAAEAEVAVSDSTKQKGSKFEEMVAANVQVDVDLDF